jgi:hypothetical protein
MVDGLGGDEQLRGDLGVGETGADQAENLPLAPGQPERMRTGRGARPGGDRPDAEPAHFCRVIRGGQCARAGEDFTASRSAASWDVSCRASAASYRQPEPPQSRGDSWLPRKDLFDALLRQISEPGGLRVVVVEDIH